MHPLLPEQHLLAKPPRFLDQVKRCIRDKHFSLRTEEAYVYWIRWFIRFHGLRHPAEMGAAEVRAFLSYLSNERSVSVSTHKQALDGNDDAARERCRLRSARDHDPVWQRRQGPPVLPLTLVAHLKRQVDAVHSLYDTNRTGQRRGVMLTEVLERKYPRAAIQWGWFWVFPSDHESTDPRSGIVRRHHMFKQTFQRAVKQAVKAAQITKPAISHSFRHSFATHMLESGYDI